MGRRVPYVLFGAIPLGLSFFFLWTPPGHSPAVLAGTSSSSSSSLTASTASPGLPTPPSSRKSRRRCGIGSPLRRAEVLAVIALLLSYILAPILADTVGYIWMGAIMGALVAIGYLVSTIGIRERPLEEEGVVGLLQSLKIVLSSVPFRWFLGPNMAKEYIWLALAATLPFWRKYALGIWARRKCSGCG
jgi:GPH family glycoside/pentoside/hexuronide:cation symporter